MWPFNGRPNVWTWGPNNDGTKWHMPWFFGIKDWIERAKQAGVFIERGEGQPPIFLPPLSPQLERWMSRVEPAVDRISLPDLPDLPELPELPNFAKLLSEGLMWSVIVFASVIVLAVIIIAIVVYYAS